MFIVDRLSNAFTAAKSMLSPDQGKKKEQTATATTPAAGVPQQNAGPGCNTYYVDTISKAENTAAKIDGGVNTGSLIGSLTVTPTGNGRVETRLELISAKINAELAQEDRDRDFDKLQTMIYQVIMMMMRLAAKSDQDNIRDLNVKVKKQAQDIKDTYNTWQGLSVTILSSGISVAGGCAGLAPFLPAALITTESAKYLMTASQGIGSAGTGIGGIGSIFNNRSEGTRQVYQIHLKRLQDTEEERKGSKHTKGDHIKTAKAALEEFHRMKHEANKASIGRE